MISSLLPAIVVFGALLAIALFGLVRSDSASGRLHASSGGRDPSSFGGDGASRYTDPARR